MKNQNPSPPPESSPPTSPPPELLAALDDLVLKLTPKTRGSSKSIRMLITDREMKPRDVVSR